MQRGFLTHLFGLALVLVVLTSASPGAAKDAEALFRFLQQEAHGELVQGELRSTVPTTLDEVQFTTKDILTGPFWFEGDPYFVFKIRTPDQPADLFWMFVPKGGASWYIYPESGTMTGFKNFNKLTVKGDSPGVYNDGDLIIYQKHDAQYLEPNRNYFIYFKRQNADRPVIPISINWILK